MITKNRELPFYTNATIFLVGLFAFIAILYIAQEIIVPIVFSIILAILLHPVVNFFVRLKVNRIISIFITLALSLSVIVLFFLLVYSQAMQFSESWPIMVERFTAMINGTIADAAKFYDIKPEIIHNWINKTQTEIISTNSSSLGKTLMSLGSGLVIALLVPVYVFLMLYYHPILIGFTHKVFAKYNKENVSMIISKTKNVVQQYLFGLIIETSIIAVMNIIVLLILGIQYAVVLGIIGALLNLIPYIGGLVGVALPMMIAFVTKDSGWFAIYVLIGYYIIQLIDNNYIVPKIVASKVKINALFSIIVVLAGNALWGVTGMFLSIPLLAIVKVIFDHVEVLKPWGFLLGDTMPNLLEIKTTKTITTHENQL